MMYFAKTAEHRDEFGGDGADRYWPVTTSPITPPTLAIVSQMSIPSACRSTGWLEIGANIGWSA